MTDAERDRYAKSAAKQLEWWANLTPEQRAEIDRKRAAGLRRYREGRKPGRPSKTDGDRHG